MNPTSPSAFEPPSSARPTLLTILCVLTFLSCAWGVFEAVSSYFAADLAGSATEEALSEAREEVAGREGGALAERILGSVANSLTPERIRQLALAKLLNNLLTLVGAILMWNLRKTGFYVYVAGVLVAILAPMFIFDGFLAGVASAGTAFVSIIFVVLYALNLKYMR